MRHLSKMVLTILSVLILSVAVPFYALAASDFTPAYSLEEDLFTLINAKRAENNLPAFTIDPILEHASEARCLEIQSFFSHKRTENRGFHTILDNYDLSYTAAAEILAYGQASAEQTLASWMKSELHKKPLLSEQYTRIGVAHTRSAEGVHYWEILFLN